MAGIGPAGESAQGAAATAQVCGEYGPMVQVPDAGRGEARGGINRWTAILEQFRSAQAILDEQRPSRLLTAGETAPATSPPSIICTGAIPT